MTPEKQEVLRYLGHRGQAVDAELNKMVDQAMARCREIAKPLWSVRIFPISYADTASVCVEGTPLMLSGTDIAQHLRGADAAGLLAVTLGALLDREIAALEHRDLTASLLLDAAATQLIEQICDEACGEIARQAAERNRQIGSRFSPGYGDLPLTIQPTLLSVLDAQRRIGLTCTKSLILLPRKSVTAIVGLYPHQPVLNPDRCAACMLKENCRFRKDGISCEHSGTDQTANPAL